MTKMHLTAMLATCRRRGRILAELHCELGALAGLGQRSVKGS
jgi:hypothetical protein